jgi:hypothetical protein
MRNLYNYIIKNPSILELDDEADETFHEFYDVLKTGNFARFDTVRAFFESNDFSSALNLVSSITDTNIVEEQLKSVYNLLCERQLDKEIFSSADSSFLNELAEINLVLYGEAILVPRINLFLEIHDAPLGSSSRVKSNSTPKKDLKTSLQIYPNPADDLLTLEVKNIENGFLELINITGEVVKREQFKRNINVKDLNPGMYFIRLKSENSVLMGRFIISR